MRILQVFNQYRFRGGEEAWVDIIPELLGDSATVEDLRYYSEEWVGSNKPSLLKQAIRIGDNPASRAALRDKVRAFRPDALLFHNIIPVGSLGLYDEARKLGIPVLQYTHNFRPFSPGGTLWDGKKVTNAALRGNPWPEILAGAWQGSRLKTAILAWHLQRARTGGMLDCIDRWVAVSYFMRDQFMIAGVPKDRISVLRHCWDGPTSPPMEAEGDHYLFLGRLVPEKGIISLLDAWKLLSDQLGAACPKLVIAGSGPLEQHIQKASESSFHIEFVGYVDGGTKQQLISRSRAMLVPSICWESLGLTVYEAFANRRPAIVSGAGALQETVTEKVNGWKHRPDDAADLFRAVMEAENSGTEGRMSFGIAGQEWLQRHAGADAWRQQFLSICERSIQSKKVI